MRPKKNADTIYQTYKFWIKPSDPLPQLLWDKAKAMNAAWTSLVLMRQETLETWMAQRDTLTADQKRAFWNTFNLAVREKIEECELDWETSGVLHDRFLVAHQRALKDKADLHGRTRLQRILLVHRYTGGGIPIEKLLSTRAWRFALDAFPTEDVYATNTRQARRGRQTQGRFGLDNETAVEFSIILHRPLPPAAIVKRVALSGRRQKPPAHEWDWALVVSVEVPNPSRTAAGRVIGIDLGWRKIDDYLRIGYAADDTDQQIELRLPLDFSTQKARSAGYPCDHAELRALEGWIAVAVDATKAAIGELITVPSLVLMRQGGLVRLQRTLSEKPDLSEAEVEALRILGAWRKQNDRLQKIYNFSTARFAARRRWLYQNLAAWLCRNYDVIAIEGDLDVKGLAEEPDPDPALKAAQRYRQIAAPGELREIIRWTAQREGVIVKDCNTAYSTTTCFTCGEQAEAGPDLILECPAGHRFDQDANAAANLLSQILPSTEVQDGLRKNQRDFLRIPPELQMVAVVVHRD